MGTESGAGRRAHGGPVLQVVEYASGWVGFPTDWEYKVTRGSDRGPARFGKSNKSLTHTYTDTQTHRGSKNMN